MTGAPRGLLAAGAALVAWAAVVLPPPVTRPGSLESALAAVSGERFRAHVEFLADDLLEGRETGTRGYDIAARYVAAELRSLGLDPAGTDGSFLQTVPIVESRPTEGRLRLKRGTRTQELEPGEDFLIRGDLRRTRSKVTAPVVFVGHGISAPDLAHDDYEGVEVGGRIVALLPGAPERFPSEERAHFASRDLKAAEAARRGAVGLLYLHTAEDERRVPWKRLQRYMGKATTWLHPDGTPAGSPAGLQGIAVLSTRGAERLFAGAGRSLEETLEAAGTGRGGALDLRVVCTIESRSEHRRFSSPNVVGRLRGSDPALAETHVVYSAHLDHEGIGRPVDGDAIYNGAYDNASGIAVVLEVARAMAGTLRAPRRSILFLLVTAEEKGLLGSEYFAAYPTVPANGLVANINVDMPLFLFPLADVVALGAETSSLGEAVSRAAARVGLSLSQDPMPEENLFIRSDQYSFVRRGVPAVYLVPGFRSDDPSVDGEALWRGFLGRHYHTPSDDLSQPMDLDSAERFIRANVEIGWTVAEAEEPPRWRTDSVLARRFASARAD